MLSALEIGKIIKGESQILYWVQVNAPSESAPEPSPEDCAFGSFVRIPVMKRDPSGQRILDRELIGVIFDTMLIDRDMLRQGPRLTQDPSQVDTLFPIFFVERIKVVRVLLIGQIYHAKNIHRFATTTMGLGDPVYKMEESEVSSFHKINNEFQIGYYSELMSYNENLVKPLMLDILSRLMILFPDDQEFLQLLHNNIEYDMKIGGF